MYLRISADTRSAAEKRQSEEASAGVQRQREDCAALIQAKGWTLVEEYADDDKSATGAAERPGFERLLADVRSGKITRIVAWARDRLSRNLFDTARLEEIAKSYGVLVTVHPSTTYDLTDPADMLNFQVLGSVAKFETSQKHKRHLAANEQRRADGELHLRRRVYGYEVNPEKVGRTRQNPYDCVRVDEEEAAIVREMFARVLAGDDNMRALVRDLDARGARTAEGNRFSTAALNRLLRLPIYGGFVYRVEKDGGKRTTILYPDVEPAWTPLVSRDDWEAVQEILRGRTITYNNGGRAGHKSWMTGVLHCGQCGGRLHVNRTMLVCRANDHGMGIEMSAAEPVVERYLVGRVAMEGQRLRLADPAHERVEEIRAELATLEEELAVVGDIKSMMLRVQEMNRITERQEALHVELARHNSARSLTGVIADLVPWVHNGAASFLDLGVNTLSVKEAWQGLSDRQRQKIAGLLGHYVVEPAAPGRMGAKRVRIFPRDPLTGEISEHSIDEDADGRYY
jgi:DNA invertase Pin-like site-specific DNA recombinase